MPLQIDSRVKPCLRALSSRSSIKKKVTIDENQNILTEFDRPSTQQSSIVDHPSFNNDSLEAIVYHTLPKVTHPLQLNEDYAGE